jgi:selenocysteine lyase/cysteine desulfurase
MTDGTSVGSEALAAEAYGATPNPLARHYTRFRVADRLLLTGHSHQAWPDVALEGHERAWLDAAGLVDEKWTKVAEQTAAVVEGYRGLLGGMGGDLAIDANTHALVVRLLSALPLRDRRRIVTTDGEFHTVRRQLDRLGEEGVEIVRVACQPVDSLAERVGAAVDDRTACAMVSSVLFETGRIVPGLPGLARACRRVGAELLLDTYHHLGVVPFRPEGLDEVFVVGGGYKYCQLGEGVCFLRIPEGCTLRPVITGWFSEFGEMAEAKRPGVVSYGAGAGRFAGSTFDPTSHYRAARVFRFFRDEGLRVPLLRAISRRQVDRLLDAFLDLDADPDVISADTSFPREARAGFLALRARDATGLQAALRARGVRTDARGSWLRFGPAPYLEDRQLDDAMAALGEALAAV